MQKRREPEFAPPLYDKGENDELCNVNIVYIYNYTQLTIKCKKINKNFLKNRILFTITKFDIF